MKRSLIAMAVATAMIVPATAVVAGDIKVYAHAQVEVYDEDHESTTATDGLHVKDNARGRVGFKASEDLGNGWKGLAKFEYKANTAGGGGISDRETMVGLKSKAVQIELGQLKSAYKYAGGVKYDPFVATLLQARGNGGMVSKPKAGGVTFGALGQSSFHPEAIGLRTKAGPIKLGFTYAPSEGDGSMTASAMFKKGKIEAFIALVDSGDTGGTAPGSPSYTATKIGGKMKVGKIAIMAQIEMTEEDTGTATTEPTYTFLGAQMKMGKNTFVAQYGLKDNDGTTTNGDIDMITIGAIHKFTKMTRLFGGFRSSSTDDNTQEDIISIGLRKDF